MQIAVARHHHALNSVPDRGEGFVRAQDALQEKWYRDTLPQLVDHAPIGFHPRLTLRSAHRETHRLAASLNRLLYALAGSPHVRLGIDLVPEAALRLRGDFFERLARTAADYHHRLGRCGASGCGRLALRMELLLVRH